MTSSVRRFVRVVCALLLPLSAVVPATGHAQSGQIEVRLDAVRVQSYDKLLALSIAAPGSAAVAYYVTPSLAIDARFLGVSYSKSELPNGETRSATTAQLSAFLPYHFGGTRGRSGLFVAPGLTYAKSSLSNGGGSLSVFTWGAEIGFKKSLHRMVSLRAAATYEDGDRPETIGATAGISLFFR